MFPLFIFELGLAEILEIRERNNHSYPNSFFLQCIFYLNQKVLGEKPFEFRTSILHDKNCKSLIYCCSGNFRVL